jgi:hypothetical protein
MSPRWGLGWFCGVECYKHAVPLELWMGFGGWRGVVCYRHAVLTDGAFSGADPVKSGDMDARITLGLALLAAVV